MNKEIFDIINSAFDTFGTDLENAANLFIEKIQKIKEYENEQINEEELFALLTFHQTKIANTLQKIFVSLA